MTLLKLIIIIKGVKEYLRLLIEAKMLLQGLTKTEVRESVNPVAKSSLEPTSDEHLMKTRQTDGRHQVSHAGRQPTQQRSDSTIADSTGMFTTICLFCASSVIFVVHVVLREKVMAEDGTV